MALQIRKVKEIPASSQQLNGSNANIINNNNTAPKHTTKDDTKSHLLRRSSRIDCHHSGDRKINSNVTTPTSTTTTASTVSRTRLYLERSAIKEYKAASDKGSAICSSNDSQCIQNHNELTEDSSFRSSDQQICPDGNDGDYVWHGDCCDDSVNLDLDIASNKNRIEKSNSVKRGKRSLSSTRVAKSNEKNIKRKTASDSPQQLTFSGKVDDKKEIKTSSAYDGGKSDHHMSLRLRKR